MQLWAAIISKFASDLVGAIIEGYFDRHHNLAHRSIDYEEKLAQVYDVYGKLATEYPEQDVLALFKDFDEFITKLKENKKKLLNYMIINSLDLMVFWMYQARSKTELIRRFLTMSKDEKTFFLKSQQVLKEKRIITEMILGGLVGKHFEKPLTFYLSYSDRYLKEINILNKYI
ncbi:MAG: hypothetical protein ABIA04_02025 [Pseudomonadota bacterium]